MMDGQFERMFVCDGNFKNIKTYPKTCVFYWNAIRFHFEYRCAL